MQGVCLCSAIRCIAPSNALTTPPKIPTKHSTTWVISTRPSARMRPWRSTRAFVTLGSPKESAPTPRLEARACAATLGVHVDLQARPNHGETQAHHAPLRAHLLGMRRDGAEMNPHDQNATYDAARLRNTPHWFLAHADPAPKARRRFGTPPTNLASNAHRSAEDRPSTPITILWLVTCSRRQEVARRVLRSKDRLGGRWRCARGRCHKRHHRLLKR